jgi:hypothetical protein
MSFRKERYSEYTQNTQFGVMVEWFDKKDNSKNQFFSGHYSRILRAINKQWGDTKVEHELTGKKIFIDGEEHWVESVHKHWNIGYYLVILYYRVMENGGHSHGTLYYENITCHDPFTLETIEETKKILTF